MFDPNIGALRALNKRLVQTPFREGWEYRVEVEKAPVDWDLFCKEIVQTPIELEVATQRVGAHYLSYLNGAQPVSLTLTMRDHVDGRIYDWFEAWCGEVVSPKGTWGLPIDYLRTVKIHARKHDGSEYLRQKLRVQPLSLGELTESVEPSGSLLEFPITLIEFRGGETNY